MICVRGGWSGGRTSRQSTDSRSTATCPHGSEEGVAIGRHSSTKGVGCAYQAASDARSCRWRGARVAGGAAACRAWTPKHGLCSAVNHHTPSPAFYAHSPFVAAAGRFALHARDGHANPGETTCRAFASLGRSTCRSAFVGRNPSSSPASCTPPVCRGGGQHPDGGRFELSARVRGLDAQIIIRCEPVKSCLRRPRRRMEA